MRASWWTAVAAGICLSLAGCSKEGGKVASADEVSAAKTAAGTANGRCPVLTDELVDKDAPTRTYKDPVSGKDVKVGFCCTKCPKDFDKDPEKYMKRMRDEPAKFAYAP